MWASLKQFERIKNMNDLLVLRGQSCTGKTIWAKCLFDDSQAVLEIICASCPEPDLRDFRPSTHKAILFDDASAEMVLRQKKLFQAPPTAVRLGCSTTNCHAYDVFVSGVAMIIASNTWKSDLAQLGRKEDAEWLKKNSIVVEVGSQPLWVERRRQ